MKTCIQREYLGRFTETEFVPSAVLYDPYGDRSYQRIKTTRVVTDTISFSSMTLGVVAIGYQTRSSSYATSYTSSQSHDPSDMGPGVGDTVIGNAISFTWDVTYVFNPFTGKEYYECKLVSYENHYQVALSRADILSEPGFDTYIEDKTGQRGACRNFWDISANREVEVEIAYSWSGTFGTGFRFTISYLGIGIADVGYTKSCSGTQSFSVLCHYFSSQSRMRFYENAASADAPSSWDEVYSYVFWFSLQ